MLTADRADRHSKGFPNIPRWVPLKDIPYVTANKGGISRYDFRP